MLSEWNSFIAFLQFQWGFVCLYEEMEDEESWRRGAECQIDHLIKGWEHGRKENQKTDMDMLFSGSIKGI